MSYSVIGIDESGNKVTIDQGDRREGLYIIGATGQGKSTLIENLCVQDFIQGVGICLIDPHGDLTNGVISRMTQTVKQLASAKNEKDKKRYERLKNRLENDVIYIDLSDETYIAPFNLFYCQNPDNPFLYERVVSSFMHILKSTFDITPENARMNQYFRQIASLLLYNPNHTLLDVEEILYEDDFRRKLLLNVRDYRTRNFWNKFYEAHSKGTRRTEDISMISNKLEEFLSPIMRPWFGATKNTINFRAFMDEGKLVFIKLNLQFENISRLLANIIISQLLDAAYSRRNIPLGARRQMNVYVDEFQKYANGDFAALFTEARKYGLGLTIANQVREMIDLPIRATCDQAASVIIFQVTPKDAAELSDIFDTTPPMGEPTYERLMKEVVDYVDEQCWEPPEAEEQIKVVEEKLALIYAKEDLMGHFYIPGNIRDPSYHYPGSNIKNATPVQYKILSPSHPEWREIFSHFLRLFYPSYFNFDVQAFIHSLYIPGKMREYRAVGYAPKIRGHEIVGYYKTLVPNKWREREIRPDGSPDFIPMSTGSPIDCVGLQFCGYRDVLDIHPNIQPNIGYQFPTTLVSSVEDEIARNEMIQMVPIYKGDAWEGRYQIGSVPASDQSIIPLPAHDLKWSYLWTGSRYNEKQIYLSVPRETFSQMKSSLLREIHSVLQPLKENARYYFNFDEYTSRYYMRDRNLYVGAKEGYQLEYFKDILDIFWEMQVDEEIVKQVFFWIQQQFISMSEELAATYNEWQRLKGCYITRRRAIYSGKYKAETITETVYLSEYSRYPSLHEDVLYRKIEGKPPYGSDEVARRTANQLKQLPKYTAKVRIPSGEYTITTIDPTKDEKGENQKAYVSNTELRQKITEIQEQNRKQGYLRLRSEVDKDIADRWNNPPQASPVPAQPKLPTQLSAEAVAPVDTSDAETEPSLPAIKVPKTNTPLPTPRSRRIKKGDDK